MGFSGAQVFAVRCFNGVSCAAFGLWTAFGCRDAKLCALAGAGALSGDFWLLRVELFPRRDFDVGKLEEVLRRTRDFDFHGLAEKSRLDERGSKWTALRAFFTIVLAGARNLEFRRSAGKLGFLMRCFPFPFP